MKTRIIITGLALFAMASTAFAQSTITGTLSSGASGSTTLTGGVATSSGGSLSGTVTTGTNALTGTVTDGTTGGDAAAMFVVLALSGIAAVGGTKYLLGRRLI